MKWIAQFANKWEIFSGEVAGEDPNTRRMDVRLRRGQLVRFDATPGQGVPRIVMTSRALIGDTPCEAMLLQMENLWAAIWDTGVPPGIYDVAVEEFECALRLANEKAGTPQVKV